jgi:hypothetical protein
LLNQPSPYEYRWGWNIFQSPILPGDYNGDGVVNAGDYTVWRDTLGTEFDLNGNGDFCKAVS